MYRPRRNRTGLAMYPGELCFDPGRTEWLGYWIDTPRELACKTFNPTPIGVAPAPTGTALTVAPASGEDAAALQQSLADEALRRQVELNATGVHSNPIDQLSTSVVETGSAIASLPWGMIAAAVGVGVFALVAVGGGSARRYGR